MKTVGKLMLGAAFALVLGVSYAKADEAPAPQSEASETSTQDAASETVVVEKPVAIDAMTGQPVEPKEKEEKPSLRDQVRSKME